MKADKPGRAGHEYVLIIQFFMGLLGSPGPHYFIAMKDGLDYYLLIVVNNRRPAQTNILCLSELQSQYNPVFYDPRPQKLLDFSDKKGNLVPWNEE